MNIFCFKGIEKEISSLLKTIILNIDIEEDDFTCYTGFDRSEVIKAQEDHNSIFSFNLFSHTKKRNIKLNAFNQTCIGINTSSEYTVGIQQIRLDLSKFLLLVGGIITFFLAKKLSNNAAFFYLSGVLIGVFASILVLIWFLSKLIPKKPLMYGALISGWTLVAYFTQFFYNNIYQIIVVYQKYALIYVIVTSILSFGICYYMGPPKNKRSKNLIMWALQLSALCAIYLSSDFLEAVIAIIVTCLVLYYVPLSFPFPSVFRRIWNRLFPPKPKLLTLEEFEEQGRIETAKALKELQEFVQSPKCKQWKVVMNLSQPTRFASFVEHGSHLTLDETRLHEETINDMSSDDDENENAESESSESLYVDESVHVDQSVNLINKSKLMNIKGNLRQQQLGRSFNNKSMGGKIMHTSTPTSINGTSPSRPKRNGRPVNYEISDDDD